MLVCNTLHGRRYCLSTFACIKINGVSYQTYAPNDMCYTPQHWVVMIMGLAGLIVYVLVRAHSFARALVRPSCGADRVRVTSCTALISTISTTLTTGTDTSKAGRHIHACLRAPFQQCASMSPAGAACVEQPTKGNALSMLAGLPGAVRPPCTDAGQAPGAGRPPRPDAVRPPVRKVRGQPVLV